MIPDVGDWVIDARRERAEPETIDEENADTACFGPVPPMGPARRRRPLPSGRIDDETYR